ncbi:MAG TPA: sulfite exporter TauE/SafE family protein, partial [Candidatus Polarisedimenticolaceae bacterium]|nr:sulfite exporter TauE/SafE family protein [Candidatus Polarisedimenticolaceae bacterium]
SVIMVILLLLYPGLHARKLVGTDLLQAVPLVLAAAFSHVITQGVQWNVLIPLICGGAPGVFIGAHVSRYVHQGVVRIAIVFVLTLTGIALLKSPAIVIGCLGLAIVLTALFVARFFGKAATQQMAEPMD